jgi:hypothetical protein
MAPSSPVDISALIAPSASLESPPRMTRSRIYPGSLFRDSDSDRTDPSISISARDDNRSLGSRGSKKKKTRRDHGGGGGTRADSPSPSCGSTRFDFLSHILDVFSLNGLGCCRHDDDGGGGGGGAKSGILGGGICA